jgi:hypothetical protein
MRLQVTFRVPAAEILLEVRLLISGPWRPVNPVLHVRVAMELLPLPKRLTPMVGAVCSLPRMEGEVAEKQLTGGEKEKRPPELSVKIWPDDLGLTSTLMKIIILTRQQEIPLDYCIMLCC